MFFPSLNPGGEFARTVLPPLEQISRPSDLNSPQLSGGGIPTGRGDNQEGESVWIPKKNVWLNSKTIDEKHSENIETTSQHQRMANTHHLTIT